ncbi:MAG TPA: helicase C-terminal domain-containing protein [Rhizomicrobium sp.]|nr:helicase C-terminal domain-containing protein [Rhizomicrobium sp.]
MFQDDYLHALSLVPAARGAVLATAEGDARTISLDEARTILRAGNVLVAHAAFVASRLKTAPKAPIYDVLELFAFVRPGASCVPSAVGLARALGLDLPQDNTDAARLLRCAADTLLAELRAQPESLRARARPLAMLLARGGWRWGRLVVDCVGENEKIDSPIAGLDVWRKLPQWEDEAPPGKPSSVPVDIAESRARLEQLIGSAGEIRPEQIAYAEAATYAFAPRERAGAPKVALVEAGTGIGKTLGYLAPASLWAEKNGAGLWLSTYTRNLQRQIVQEIARLYPEPVERDAKAVVRKGRENYLCLLNFEEAAKRTALAPGQRLVALGLIARWIDAGADGDLSGAGFPSFLAASVPLAELTDRRGECVYAACSHYRQCFIEQAIRRSRRAPIVVANHALVISQATRDWTGGETSDEAPPERRVRFVFDEGHHLFDAADSGFCALLSGSEMAELRRWIRGPEGRARSRVRGLEERAKDLVADDDAAMAALEEAVAAAGALAGEGWMSRVHSALARGAGEAFLAEAYAHVSAQCEDGEGFYSREAGTEALGSELLQASRRLANELHRLAQPLAKLASALRTQLDKDADKLETWSRARIEAVARGLERRAKIVLASWIAMLNALDGAERGNDFVDRFEVAREDGRDTDVGLRRHWIDPTIPLAAEVLAPAHGALITSATLRDSAIGEDDWQAAEVRTGAHHLLEPPRRAAFGSPFRYAVQARVFVVKDVERRDIDALAAAYRELFAAAGGGAIGLFTAVRVLRGVHARIEGPLADAGLALYAQHIDRLDTGTLVDLFRAEENACLLGTDALRDGVDVPGRSLRLVVFDKVPWPKPTILHKARRARFGKSYDDLLTRLRLKQAFGRLIRSQSDKGCFVILEPATPSRLLSALPSDVPVKRCGLAETIADIKEFLATS